MKVKLKEGVNFDDGSWLDVLVGKEFEFDDYFEKVSIDTSKSVASCDACEHEWRNEVCIKCGEKLVLCDPIRPKQPKHKPAVGFWNAEWSNAEDRNAEAVYLTAEFEKIYQILNSIESRLERLKDNE